MRRYIALLLALLLGTITLVSAQEDASDDTQVQDNPEPEGIPLEAAPSHLISGQWQLVKLEELDRPPMFHELNALPAADLCVGSPNLELLPADGGTTPTNTLTESSSDPALSCTWNKPQEFTGYRSAWYRFTPSANGWVTITTAGSTYDTILAVYVGSCGTKVQLACNDDYEGFTSRLSIPVSAGLTYYIEAADRQLGVSGVATLNLGAWLTTSNRWEEVSNMDLARSRHAAVIDGSQIYIIGGQTVVNDTPVRTPAASKFDTAAGSWTPLTNMPGPDGFGYSNTTAALVGGKIYFPSGFIGLDGTYDGTHWVYDIGTNFWSTAVANSWAGGEPPIYSISQPYSSPSIPSGYFVAGGLTGPMPVPPTIPLPPWLPRDEMYYFVPSLNLWFPREPMNTGRFGHTSAMQKIGGVDHLCVVGGIGSNVNGNPLVLTQGECYNIETEQWSVVTGPMRYARYFAASGVDNSGNWIVYGGTDAAGKNVPATEVYNRQTNQWEILSAQSSLGSLDNQASPPRAWPRAGFVGSSLYAIGGERTHATGGDVINLVEALYLPDEITYLPIVSTQKYHGEPDNTMDQARLLPLNLDVFGNFILIDDRFDVYYFDNPAPRQLTTSLRNIPLGSDYNLHIYNDDKIWQGSSTNIGSNVESLSLTLAAGRYFVMVERFLPPPGSDPNPQAYILHVSR